MNGYDETHKAAVGASGAEADSCKTAGRFLTEPGAPVLELDSIDVESIKWEVLREVVERLDKAETHKAIAYALLSIASDVIKVVADPCDALETDAIDDILEILFAEDETIE